MVSFSLNVFEGLALREAAPLCLNLHLYQANESRIRRH